MFSNINLHQKLDPKGRAQPKLAYTSIPAADLFRGCEAGGERDKGQLVGEALPPQGAPRFESTRARATTAAYRQVC